MELNEQGEGTVALAVTVGPGPGQVTVNPVVGLTTEESATVPAKLFKLVMETGTAAPVAPELKLMGVLREMVKSPT